MKYGNSPAQVARYFLYLSAKDNRTLTPMQLQKLVYIAHGWHLGLYGRPLVNEAVEAWQYGPVIRSLYQEYKRYGSRPIDEQVLSKPEGFDPEEENTIEQVWRGYGSRTGVSLSALTHEAGSPWSVTVDKSGMNSDISDDLIEDHYKRRIQAQQ
jgi:uncharacterized phage-associated protein